MLVITLVKNTRIESFVKILEFPNLSDVLSTQYCNDAIMNSVTKFHKFENSTTLEGIRHGASKYVSQ